MIKSSIINVSEIQGKTRIDAEYYHPTYLKNENILSEYRHGCYELNQVLKNNRSITGGATPLGAEYLKEGKIKFIRVQNVMQNYFDLSAIVYINENIHNGLLKRSQLKQNDVLLTITGVSYGKSATVPTSMGEANINQHSVKIVLNEQLILPYFLSTFLNCKYGKYQNDRKITGLSRPGLVYSELRRLIIPKVEQTFQREIQSLVITANQFLEKSKQLYNQCEEILYKKVGLHNYPLSHTLTYTTNFSNCKKNMRIDAAYYQPKYVNMLRNLKQNAEFCLWNIKEIGDLSKPLRYGTSQKLTYVESGVPFLRITDVKDYDFDPKELCYISNEEAAMVSYAKVKEGDLVISRSGTLGLTVPISNELSGSVFGSYFIRIRPKIEIDRAYLALYLNSLLGRIQVEQNSTGAIQTNLTIPAIENIKILIPEDEFQRKISLLLQESKILRNNAKGMLEDAKIRVEKEIGTNFSNTRNWTN